MSGRQSPEQDPRAQEPAPPQPAQSQQHEHPGVGIQAEMTPQPDYGEHSYQGSGKLVGKVALITGADSGIGRAVALAFARKGADILISYLDEEQDAQETERVITEAGRRAVRVAGDIREPAHCQQLVQRAVQELGHLDIVVNNAAFQMGHQSFSEISPEELERTFRTNIFALFYLCQAAVPHLSAGSVILNTGSIQAYQPSPALLAYACTKGAIITFTKGLAQELARRGIRVNVVAPGPVWTPLIPASMPPERVQEFGQDSLLGRPAQPAELAPAYVYLASQDASYVTGERLGVTGSAALP